MQSRGAALFRAELALDHLAERVAAAKSGSVTMSVEYLEGWLGSVRAGLAVGKELHLEHASAGALAPEAFAEPVT